MLNKLVSLLCLFLLSYSIGFAAVPAIFYSDLTSGPKTGGQNNKGVFVSIYGKGFGSSQGASYVSIGGGQADNYPVWSDTKISFQLGSAAATGNIIVTTSEGASNGVPFTVRAGNIYFAKTTGNDTTGNGSWDTPWATIPKVKNNLNDGDIGYICDGVTQTTIDSYNHAVNCDDTATEENPIALVAYPGASVTVGSVDTPEGFATYISGQSPAKWWVIAGFNVTASGKAITPCEGWRIVANSITTPTATGAQAAIESGYSYVRILGNTLDTCGTANASKLYHNIYINNHNGVENTEIEIAWNTIRNSTANRGVQVYSDGTGNADISNVKIHDNLLYNLRGNGLNLSSHSAGTFEVYNNIIYKCGQGPHFLDGSSNYAGILIGGGNNIATIKLYNNNVYDCGYVAAAANSTGLLAFSSEAVSVTLEPFNNIFYSNGQNHESYMSSGSINPATGAYNNLFYGKGTAPSWDTSALNADPLLADPSAGNFYLNAGSPSINAGADVSSVVSTDKDGVPRAVNDIGAYEYTGADVTPPANVTDLSVSNTSLTSVTLAWTAPGDDGNTGTAASYDIRYNTDQISDGNWGTSTQATGEPVPGSAGSTESMVIPNLQSDTTYYFAIKTADEIPNTSGISNTISGRTGDGTAPSAVTDLMAVPGSSDGRVVVSWTAPGDDGASGIAAAYDLRLSQNNINDTNWSSATQYASEPVPKIAGSAESVTLSGLTPGATYYFALKTSDEVSNTSALSNVSSVQAYKSGEVDITAPAVITNLSAASGAHSGEVVLNWTATGDDSSTGTALAYDIRYSQILINDYFTWESATRCTGTPEPKIAGSAERFVVTGLTPGLQYYFAVQAIDGSNLNSGISNVPQALAYNPIGDTTPPEPITTLQASNTAGGEVTITWTAPGSDGASGTALYYEIRSATYTVDASNFAQASLLDSILVPNSAGFAEGAKIYNLDIGQTYYIAVKSVDGAGNVSILSNVAVVAIGADLIAPGTVADLTAVAGTDIGEVVIGWTASGNDGAIGKAKEYDIRYSTEPITDSGWQMAVKALNTPSPAVSGTYQSATIGNLTANKRYYFGIKASDTGYNVSILSNIATAKAKGGIPPGKIADLSGTVGSSDGSVVLSWTAPAAADGEKVRQYEIRYSKDHIYEVNLWRIFSDREVEWNGAGKYPVQPSVVNPGEPQAFAVINLDPGQKYFFAIKSYDSDNNSSVISNVAEALAANYDATAPAKIDDLHAEPGNVDGEVILSWTAPGDNGNAGKAGNYVVKYSARYIDSNAWDLANALADTPVPGAAGTKEHMFVKNLLAKHLYYFALKAVDPVGNVSELSNCAETLSGPMMNLELARSFPNPWKKSSGGLITISHLTAKAKVKIFNLAGELVRELDEQNGVAFWDAKNENGQDVASGMYIFYAWDDEGHKKTGKMAILK